MYEKSEFLDELDDNIIIWRYMTMASFLSLIIDKRLLFRKASTYKDYYDCYAIFDEESQKNIEDAIIHQKKPDNWIYCSRLGKGRPLMPFFKGEKWNLTFSQTGKLLCNADITYCNCWHINNNENYALWKIYLDNQKEGIAVKSTIGNLKKALSVEDDKVFLGRVNYTDKKLSLNNESKVNEHSVILRKRLQYSYESELRAFVVSKTETGDENSYDALLVDIDIEQLVQEIWISPFAGQWLLEMINRLLENLKINFTVKSSEIVER